MPDRLFHSDLAVPVRIRAHLALLLARMSRFVLRRIGRGATALPGKLALRIYPDLLRQLVSGRKVFLVTGTNGKTTTVRILCAILQNAGFSVITNPSGANLDSGLTTTMVSQLNLLKRNGGPGKKLALVFEIDEAYFAKLAEALDPSVCVVTNFFRDQLDRFGELQHTRDLIARGLNKTKAAAILCADDSLCASLGKIHKNESLYFGFDQTAMHEPLIADGQESAFCTFCGSRYDYAAMVYGHLGVFSCPGCGFSRPAPDLSFAIDEGSVRELPLHFSWHDEKAEASLSIPGLHNGYNAAAAVLAALADGLPLLPTVKALSQVDAAFGRMERFTVEDKDVCLILVKNPVGMDRALEFVEQAEDCGGVMMLLNANDPDGRDVSWIWDVNFENHLPQGQIGLSGQRCHDLALRLYYAGKVPQSLDVDGAHSLLFNRFLQHCPPGRCLYILPNYTAMLDLRADLASRYQLREFWR